MGEHQDTEPSREWMASHLHIPRKVELQCSFSKPVNFTVFIQVFFRCNYFILFYFILFKDFIYLFMRDREAETQAEGEAGSMQGARRGT